MTHPTLPTEPHRTPRSGGARPPLALGVLLGPPLASIDPPANGGIIGRLETCAIRLEHPTVSRTHARLDPLGGGWILTDLGSRHGTWINGARLAPHLAAPLRDGDRIEIGPWTLGVHIGDGPAPGRSAYIRLTGVGGGHSSVRPVSQEELGSLAERRLGMLLGAAARLSAAETESALAEALLGVVIDGAGFRRAALVRAVGADAAEILASRGGDEELNISRSLIAAAAEGGVVRLQDAIDLRQATSIIGSNISEALCAPVCIGGEIAAYLYADSPAGAPAPRSDAAAFCGAVAHLCGLALANIRRAEIEDRQRRLIREMTHAREVQQRLAPGGAGACGPVRYAAHSAPGGLVAGDLMGVLDLGGGRVAAYVGDVCGKGVGPGMIMASVQAHLHAELTAGLSPAAAMNETNAYLASICPPGEFCTLFLAVVDAAAGAIECVDAGHAYAVLAGDGGPPRWLRIDGAPPLGVDARAEYPPCTLPAAPGWRLVLFSDGVVEQPGPGGSPFGVRGVLEALAAGGDPARDVAALLTSLQVHAAGTPPADDVSVLALAAG